MKKAPFAGRSDRPHHVAFGKILRELSHKHEPWRVFSDFVEIAAISLRNAVQQDVSLEASYMKIIERYDSTDVEKFAALLGETILGLGDDLEVDFLGEVFSALELANHWRGQFFTPMALARMCAEITAPEATDPIFVDRGFIRVIEPCAGAGGMILALAAALRKNGINFQRAMHVTAIDIDRTAAFMCYVQCALWHIPALVCIGDALRPDAEYDVWPTPAHMLGMWDVRLSIRNAREHVQNAIQSAAMVEDVPNVAAPDDAPQTAADSRPQFTLF